MYNVAVGMYGIIRHATYLYIPGGVSIQHNNRYKVHDIIHSVLTVCDW